MAGTRAGECFSSVCFSLLRFVSIRLRLLSLRLGWVGLIRFRLIQCNLFRLVSFSSVSVWSGSLVLSVSVSAWFRFVSFSNSCQRRAFTVHHSSTIIVQTVVVMTRQGYPLVLYFELCKKISF